MTTGALVRDRAARGALRLAPPCTRARRSRDLGARVLDDPPSPRDALPDQPGQLAGVRRRAADRARRAPAHRHADALDARPPLDRPAVGGPSRPLRGGRTGRPPSGDRARHRLRDSRARRRGVRGTAPRRLAGQRRARHQRASARNAVAGPGSLAELRARALRRRLRAARRRFAATGPARPLRAADPGGLGELPRLRQPRRRADRAVRALAPAGASRSPPWARAARRRAALCAGVAIRHRAGLVLPADAASPAARALRPRVAAARGAGRDDALLRFGSRRRRPLGRPAGGP